MKKITQLLTLLTTTLMLSHTAFASNHQGIVTLTLAEGYDWFAPKHHLKNTALPTASLGYDFSDHWGSEFSWSNINTYQRGADPQGVHGNLFMADGIYRFNQHRHFQPYLIAGIGVQGFKRVLHNSTQQGNVNGGIGTQYFVEEWCAFRGEVRDIYTTTGGYNDVMANVGLSFLMG